MLETALNQEREGRARAIRDAVDHERANSKTQKQLLEMRRSWQKIDFESVRNQSALVCNCRHEDLVQLLEVDFVALMDTLAKTPEPVKEVMSWADKCCERLMGGRGGGVEERTTMSSRSVLIRWGYVTSQVMRDLVRLVDRNSQKAVCSSLIVYRLSEATLLSVHSKFSSCSWSEHLASSHVDVYLT